MRCSTTIIDRDLLLKRIDHRNERLKQLVLQGERSNNKTLSNLRNRRNKDVRQLLKLLAPEISFHDELNAIRNKEK